MLEVIRERIDELKKLEEQLQAIENDPQIIEYKTLLRDIDETKGHLNNAIECADIDTIKDWTPGRKSGQDEYWEGTTGIIRTKKTNRKIISDRFVKLYPFLAGKLAKFTLKDVEPQIGPEELEAVIAREEVFSYKPTTRMAPAAPEPIVKKTKTSKKKTGKLVKST